jgi:hypothetical protein
MMIGLGLVLGGLAAAFAAFAAFRRYRSRTITGTGGIKGAGRATRARRNTADTPASASYAASAAVSAPPMEQASMDWIIAGRGMDTLVPAAYSIPLPETQDSNGTEADDIRSPASHTASTTASEPWVEALRKVMEHKPLKYGYDKSVWTAPLLGHYLQETHGVSVTPARLRIALRDLGYHWKHTHYAYLRPGTGRHH